MIAHSYILYPPLPLPSPHPLSLPPLLSPSTRRGRAPTAAAMAASSICSAELLYARIWPTAVRVGGGRGHRVQRSLSYNTGAVAGEHGGKGAGEHSGRRGRGALSSRKNQWRRPARSRQRHGEELPGGSIGDEATTRARRPPTQKDDARAHRWRRIRRRRSCPQARTYMDLEAELAPAATLPCSFSARPWRDLGRPASWGRAHPR
jgi:hypothetical protein